MNTEKDKYISPEEFEIIQDSYDMKKKEKTLVDRIKVKPIQHNEQLQQKEQERNGVEKDENSNSQYLGDL